MRLEDLNSLPKDKATDEFLKCCGSINWARRMADDRPFASLDELLKEAERIWWSLEPFDWLGAFSSHPKIGEKTARAHVSDDAQRWSEQEQAGAGNATRDTMLELSQLNQRYEQKFGHIYIVCATGKSAEEMLVILKDRMNNSSDNELRVAAGEQVKITELRLKRLLES